MRLVASGPIDATYTPDNLQKTFGARLERLETAGRSFPGWSTHAMISFNTVVVLVSAATLRRIVRIGRQLQRAATSRAGR